ncbi:hypothetical protein K504DRAFT_462057 [Pleomassaria siparia CBS 279.74]|uniref:Uncharacterized protein n=1 Tax=Pleomassaria siparia CBS 279.74 TaxID=1314801 RepID=A0A6G1KMI7_9PLEO|nr:hypothetical protein K504DRAFT_462057 [Pleomassaria siparia CBS 279.74]
MVSYDPFTAQQQQQQAVEMTSLKPATTTTTTLSASSASASASASASEAEAAFELEKSQITSYEQGWDRWDGPVWPLGTVQCSLQNPTCRLTPCPEHHPAEAAFEREKAAIKSYEEGWDRWDGPVWPLGTVQCALQDPECRLGLCEEHHPAKAPTTPTQQK